MAKVTFLIDWPEYSATGIKGFKEITVESKHLDRLSFEEVNLFRQAIEASFDNGARVLTQQEWG